MGKEKEGRSVALTIVKSGWYADAQAFAARKSLTRFDNKYNATSKFADENLKAGNGLWANLVDMRDTGSLIGIRPTA